MNICNADIHKAADQIGIGGDAERYRWFVGCRTAPGVDKEPRVRDLDVPRRADAVASAHNATSEDRFVKSKRSLDVGDGEKVCDGKPLLRRHLIGFLLDLYLAHGRLRFGYGLIGFPNAIVGGSSGVGKGRLSTCGHRGPDIATRRVEQGTDRSDGMFGQERENKTRDVVVLLVQGEMAGIKQVDFAVRQIALESLRTGCD